MDIRKALTVSGLSLSFAVYGWAAQTNNSKQDAALTAKGGKPEDKPNAEKPERLQDHWPNLSFARN